MELVLQWLDELEDLVFAIALAWEDLRRLLLQVGLGAALALLVPDAALGARVPTGLLTAVAVASVGAWLTALLVLLAAKGKARGAAA